MDFQKMQPEEVLQWMKNHPYGTCNENGVDVTK
jgi:hypothetical protein